MRTFFDVCYQKAIKACPGKGRGTLSESGRAIPFSPQDFCSLCKFVRFIHNTWTPLDRVCISNLFLQFDKNKVRLICLQCICAYFWASKPSSGLSSYPQNYIKPNTFTIWSFTGKSSPNSALEPGCSYSCYLRIDSQKYYNPNSSPLQASVDRHLLWIPEQEAKTIKLKIQNKIILTLKFLLDAKGIETSKT